MNFRYLALLLIILPLKAMSPAEKQYYTQKYAVPAELKKTLDATKPTRNFWNIFFKDINYLGNKSYFVEEQLDRLKGKDIIDQTAAKHQCDLVITPQKYAYAHPDNPKRTVLIVEDIKNADKPFNLNQIQQICTVVRKSKYWDVHPAHIKPTAHGKVAFTDTEMLSFNGSHGFCYNLIASFLPGSCDKYQERKMALQKIADDLSMTHEAQQHVIHEIRNEEARQAIHEWVEEEQHSHWANHSMLHMV